MILEFINISKSFRSKKALHNLSFGVELNECVGLIGNNGSGKTTIVHLALNLIQASSGIIRFSNKKHTVGYNKFRKSIGIVLSEPFYIESFSVQKYIRFVGKFQGLDNNTIINRSTELFELLNISNFIDKKTRDLSSGNKVKVSIIAALIHNPDFLVFDEPFTHLDFDTQQTILDILLSIKEKKTIIITSHNLELVCKLCDRFLVLDNGELILDVMKAVDDSPTDLEKRIKRQLRKNHSIENIEWLK